MDLAEVLLIFTSLAFWFRRRSGQLGFPIRTILAVFYLQVTPMLPTKFQVNWPFSSGEEAKKKIFKRATMVAILDFWSKQFYLFLIYKSPWCILLSFESIGPGCMRSRLLQQIVDAALGTLTNHNCSHWPLGTQVKITRNSHFSNNLYKFVCIHHTFGQSDSVTKKLWCTCF